jgi:cobalamin biosynthesis protein CobW
MKIPATVITGFLGAGKTTLIRHILENAGGKRIALIINEFGDLGIDRELITGCGIDGCEDDRVVELANGCICCTVADDFLPTIETLLDRPDPPDHIVIETSGLALPKPLVKAFNWPEVRSRVAVDGVVVVIDAPAVAAGQFAADPQAVMAQRTADDMLDHERPLHEVFEDQVSCADLIIINKSDLLDADALAGVHAGLRDRVAAPVHLINAIHGAIDPKITLGLGADVGSVIENRPSHHDGEDDGDGDGEDDHDHDDFESFLVELGDCADPEGLEARIKSVAVAHDILRIKGFAHVPGKDRRHVIQAVGASVQRYYDRAWTEAEDRTTKLVVIGQAGLDQAAIKRALRAPSKRALRAPS